MADFANTGYTLEEIQSVPGLVGQVRMLMSLPQQNPTAIKNTNPPTFV